MARKHPAQAGKAAAAAAICVLSASAFAAAAWAQDKAAQPAPMPAPFVRDCRTAAAADVSESPLPNVAAALKTGKVVKIIAIGASPSVGRFGVRGSYTDQIEQILEQAVKGLDAVVVNRGVSGELAAQAAQRIRVEVALNEPELVLWQVGTNDALAYVPIDDLRETLLDTIQWLKAHRVDVVLAGLQFVNRMEQDEQYRAVRELIRKVGEQEKVIVVRSREAKQLITQAAQGGGGLLPQEFAQTEIGYACLAEYVARAITLGAFGRGLRDQPPAPPGAGPANPTPANPTPPGKP